MGRSKSTWRGSDRNRIQSSTRRQDRNEAAFFREVLLKPEKRLILVIKNGRGASEVYRVDVYPF
jgi:hypothetical protein